MRSFRDIPIRRKLTLLMMMISVVALSLVGAAVVSYELVNSKRAETEDLATKAAIIGADSRGALLAGNTDAALESLAALRADRDIVVAALYTAEGKLLAHYVRRRGETEPPFPLAQNAKAGTDNPQTPSRRIRFVDKSLLPAAPRPDGETFSSGHLEMFRRIVLRDETIGTVYLRSALLAYHARLRSYGLIMVGVLLVSSLVALALSARLQSVFSDPILNLARLAQDVTERKDYSLRAEKDSDDEVGQLTGAFNQALTGIQERETALRTANEQLERQTQQLQIELAERKRAEGQLLERARLTALEADVGIALTSNENLRGALHQCAEAVVHRLDAAFARIWTLNAADDVLELQASAGLYTHLDGAHSRVPVGKLTIGMIAQDRKPHLTNSVIGDPRVNDQEWAKREGMVAFAGYPLVVEDRLVGVMALFARKPLPDATRQAMASVANAIALGIERKRAETVLRETEERLQSILDNSPTVIHAKDTEGRYVLMNRRWEILYHLSAHEFAGKTPYDLFPKETADEVLANDRQVLETGRPLEFEEVIPFADGTRTYLSVKFPLRDAAGVTRGLCGISTDITERKRADRRLATQYAVTRVLSESPTLVEACPQILHTICETAGWEVGAFWSVDEESNLLRCVDVFHLPGLNVEEFEAHTRQRTFAAGVGLPGRIWSGGEPAWIPDVTQDSNFPRAPVALRVGLRGAFGFPIRRGNTISGVMEFFSHEVQQPDNDLLEMTAAIGRQIGQFMERRRAEEALRQAEEKYRGIFENAVEGIFQTTPDGRYLSVNPALARMLGYESPEELLASVTDIEQQLYVIPERRADFKRRMDESGIVQGIEIELYRKDRSRIWTSENARAVRDADGRVLYYEGVVEDNSERKRAEALLRDSEQLFRATFEQAAVGVAQVGTDGRWLRVNQKLCDIVGYTRDELLARTFQDITHPDDLNADLQFIRRMLAGEIQTYSMEKRYFRKGGSVIWINLTVSLLRGPSSAPRYFISIVEEITARKRAEEALGERVKLASLDADIGAALTDSKTMSDALHRCCSAFVNHLDAAFARIWTLNSEGNVLELQASAGMYTHIDGGHARVPVGQSKIGLIAQDRKAHLTNSVGGDPRVHDQKWAKREGMVAFAGYPLLVEDRLVGVVAMFARKEFPNATLVAIESVANSIAVDIDRRHSEERLRQTLADLQKSHEELKAAQLRLIQAEKMESIGRLAAGVAHEVKNPLAIALMGLEYLSTFFSSGDETLHSVLKDMKNAIERADSVIRGLLDFSAPTHLDSKVQDLNKTIERSLGLVRHEFGKSHIKLVKKLGRGLPSLRLDGNKIEQVFVNIFMNAMQAMPKGGILRVKTRVRQEGNGFKTVIAEVDDTGSGIPQNKLAKVFDPYFTTKPVGEGTGLGLSVAKQIIELHGGAIQISNQPEGGVRVTVTFRPSEKQMHKKRTVLIDDDGSRR